MNDKIKWILEQAMDARDRITNVIDLLEGLSAQGGEDAPRAGRDLEELVKEAIENCMANKCIECPFKGSPSRCLAILMHKLKIRC